MFMIYWNNGDYAWPMGHDDSCVGAVCIDESKPVMFESRKDAEKAIRISKANATLRKDQGLPANDDFLQDTHLIKIVKLTPYKSPLVTRQ